MLSAFKKGAMKKYEVEADAAGTSNGDQKTQPLAPADGQNQEFQPLIEDVNVTTDIVVIGGGPTFVAAVKCAANNGGKYAVTAVMGNPFLEWQQACGIFLGDPKRHKEFLCGRMETFAVKGVEYIADCVTKIDPESRTISFGSRKSTLRYRACIVATGRRLPLLAPRPGDSLLERMAEVRSVGKAISQAHTVLLVGAGLIGVEVAADLRLRNRQVERIILLSRTGKALSDTHAPDVQERVSAKLAEMGVTLLKGSISSDHFDEFTPVLQKGTAPLVEGSDETAIEFDIYIPTFAQGPNTTFLAGSGVLDANGWIESTTCLQSKARPEIFGAGVNNMPQLGHPINARLPAEGITCAHNAKQFLNGVPNAELKPHADGLMPPVLPRPVAIKIGHGKGGYAMWDAQPKWDPPSVLCCVPCGGGYPFCPPPCCWCAPGCATCCAEKCNGARESEGLAQFFESTLLPFSMNERFHYAPVKLPPEAMEMARQPL